jgi:hypothetical protein
MNLHQFQSSTVPSPSLFTPHRTSNIQSPQTIPYLQNLTPLHRTASYHTSSHITPLAGPVSCISIPGHLFIHSSYACMHICMYQELYCGVLHYMLYAILLITLTTPRPARRTGLLILGRDGMRVELMCIRTGGRSGAMGKYIQALVFVWWYICIYR